MAMAGFEIKDGEYTKTIYSMIKESRFNDAIAALSYIYDSHPTSRAALSLLAYCYFYTQVIYINFKRNAIYIFYLLKLSFKIATYYMYL
jgi:hypothetical protein